MTDLQLEILSIKNSSSDHLLKDYNLHAARGPEAGRFPVHPQLHGLHDGGDRGGAESAWVALSRLWGHNLALGIALNTPTAATLKTSFER